LIVLVCVKGQKMTIKKEPRD